MELELGKTKKFGHNEYYSLKNETLIELHNINLPFGIETYADKYFANLELPENDEDNDIYNEVQKIKQINKMGYESDVGKNKMYVSSIKKNGKFKIL